MHRENGTLGIIIGALVAIPVAAALKLLLEEVAAPRLDERAQSSSSVALRA